jgi:hypothetical protein
MELVELKDGTTINRNNVIYWEKQNIHGGNDSRTYSIYFKSNDGPFVVKYGDDKAGRDNDFEKLNKTP